MLEHKKKLAHILMEPEEDRFLKFDIRNVPMSKFNSIAKDVVHLDEENEEAFRKVTQLLEGVRVFWTGKDFWSIAKLDRSRNGVKIAKD